MPALKKHKDVKYQVASMPLRINADGHLQVLLVTSRETRRWVLPKGNLMKGKTPSRAAAIEALEEAGVTGKISKTPYDSFQYWKRGRKAFAFAVVEVFVLIVTGRRASWKEKKQRRQVWVTPTQASVMVLEPGLQSILYRLADDEDIEQVVRDHASKEQARTAIAAEGA
ncbi:NUDIX hydrolase [Aureimonas fodinaquatilis]|uniref:NUDIX hydrolase n=1 Tax=Aureimonas fodinaquatilis TaxID=2565783 RepID=A0A5B0E3W9_9HYPH|nr:NUDIX hydrolase [Aureimonas fodinaquatilis]KAA0972099.1 NUDIX hydrolase [Aureimonas fodinaquatilis]